MWSVSGSDLSPNRPSVPLALGHGLDHHGTLYSRGFHPYFLLSNGTLSSNKIKYDGGIIHIYMCVCVYIYITAHI